MDKRLFIFQKLSREALKPTESDKRFYLIITNTTDIIYRKQTNSVGQSNFWKASAVNSGEILSPFQKNQLLPSSGEI